VNLDKATFPGYSEIQAVANLNLKHYIVQIVEQQVKKIL